MRKVEDYLRHAKECRAMIGRSRTEEEKQMLLNMAETWESLAKDRAERAVRQSRLQKLEASE